MPEDSKISHKNTKIHKITQTKYDTKLHTSTHIVMHMPTTILGVDLPGIVLAKKFDKFIARYRDTQVAVCCILPCLVKC